MIDNCKFNLPFLSRFYLFLKLIVPICQVPCKPRFNDKVDKKSEYNRQFGHLITAFFFDLFHFDVSRVQRRIPLPTALDDVVRKEGTCDNEGSKNADYKDMNHPCVKQPLSR